MSEFLHKKVRIEDNGLTLKGRVIADDKVADSFTENNETEESLRGSFLYAFLDRREIVEVATSTKLENTEPWLLGEI